MPSSRRRDVLRTTAVAVTSLVAGCQGSDEEPTETAPATTAESETPPATEEPDEDATETEREVDRESLAREFVDHLAADEVTAAMELATDSLTRRYSPGGVRRLWAGAVAQHGPHEAFTDLETDGNRVVGTLVHGLDTETLEVTVTENGIRAFRFTDEYESPTYADAAAFEEREVQLETPDCSLPGTLSVPATAGPHPGVVLVHGSGRADRDQTVGQNKPFRDLAEGLASRGVAVCRYDKRTYHDWTEGDCDLGLAEWDVDTIVVDDALVATDHLRGVDGVDPDAVAVVGHSLGATCTPRILDRAEWLAGGAMLAPTGRPMPAVFLDQLRHLETVVEGSGEQAGRRAEAVEDERDRLRAGEVGPSEIVGNYPGSWWNSLREYDHLAVAASLSRPLIALQGGRDYQVDPEADFAPWRDLLGEDRTAMYPDCNHLFQEGYGPSLGQEYFFFDNVRRSVVEDLANWVGRLAD